MHQDINATLSTACQHLKDMGNGIADLANTYADVFTAPEIAEQLDAFRNAYTEALEKLNSPKLYIATIGTTSSGKSTIVNALIGRKIAPIESGEMSGGVLTLKHAAENTLVVEDTEGATWETGTWTELSDDAMYGRIRNQVMLPYHTMRKKSECIAPQVTAFCPLLPVQDASLLGLPEGMDVEFIDLPGLKSIQDGTNLAIIQSRVQKAFSLVALDYMQVDDEHRRKLLDELKKVVSYLQGRTDSMIFVLNRVDQRGEDDLPIEERVNQLREEIRDVLGLNELPDVLPFSARLLYYAQCAWGTAPIHEASLVKAEKRREFLKAMLKDCASIITQQVQENPDLLLWELDIKQKVYKQEAIDDDLMRQILSYAVEWSGGKDLWNCFRQRIEESCSVLILQPALTEIFDNFNALITSIETLAKVREIQYKEEAKSELERIEEITEKLYKDSEEICKKFDSDISEIVNVLKDFDKEGEAEKKRKLQVKLSKSGKKGFQELFELINYVDRDISKNLIEPIKKAFNNKESAFDLREDLCKAINLDLAEDLARAYDLVTRKLQGFDPTGQFLRKRVKADDRQGIQELEHAQRAVRTLYHVVRKATSSRAKFLLQTKMKVIQDALKELFVGQQDEFEKLCFRLLPALNVHKSILSRFRSEIIEINFSLPRNLFKVQMTADTKTLVLSEKVDEREEIRSTGSCFGSTYTETVDVYDDIPYQELTLPDIDEMVKHWSEGIRKEERNLWDILNKEIKKYSETTKRTFKESIKSSLQMVNNALIEQMKVIDENYDQEIQKWQKINKQVMIATEKRSQLESLMSSSVDARA